ncbi:LANO_0F11056g1_1 [Lachancea nothofagi CBS 11611]|uniref:LANO_0F11056g1_1 n=1 Tax=Lachancea nothofagi CBS 11611 TaxID=1266666 RepID=A0A1G4KAR6_9SACH|nr:LANO_0F11056g1_1 [Lachancea nothofagi CBS 11611]
MSDENIQQFMALSNAPLEVAQTYLNEFPDLGDALDAFYAAQNGTSVSSEAQEPQSSRALGNVGNDISSSKGSRVPSKSSSPAAVKRTGNSTPKFKSFSDILKENTQDEDDEQRNTFAGGETSGLEVADPGDPDSLIRDLLEKARRGGQKPSSHEDENASGTSQDKEHHFTGKGFRLGSSLDAPAQVTNDTPEEPLPSRPQKVTREITFWKEGFQVNDGDLYRYDDPANSYYLNELNQGRAPLRLLNVEFGQEVDVNVNKKLDESFKLPKRKVQGFHGKGHRLGSPFPGESVSPEAAPEPTAKDSSPPLEDKTEEPKGDTSVQIRYASGKREVLRCNSNDTVKFLYDHVKEGTSTNKVFTLNHAFPVKPIEDFEKCLKDEGLCNAVVVQRWV